MEHNTQDMDAKVRLWQRMRRAYPLAATERRGHPRGPIHLDFFNQTFSGPNASPQLCATSGMLARHRLMSISNYLAVGIAFLLEFMWPQANILATIVLRQQ